MGATTDAEEYRDRHSFGALRQRHERNTGNSDLIVSFSLAEESQRGVTGRGLRNIQAISNSIGTLVVDLTRRDTKTLVWHGVYVDNESSPARLAKKLRDDARKLLSDYPPKKKK